MICPGTDPNMFFEAQHSTAQLFCCRDKAELRELSSIYSFAHVDPVLRSYLNIP